MIKTSVMTALLMVQGRIVRLVTDNRMKKKEGDIPARTLDHSHSGYCPCQLEELDASNRSHFG